MTSAFRAVYGGVLPRIEQSEAGKPFFPDCPDIHFSISHSNGHIAVGLSESPVGVDIELPRRLRPSTSETLMSQRERECFSFFELWVLRESFFKLTGRGSLRDMRFERDGSGNIAAPGDGVRCALYSGFAGPAIIAVCAYDEPLAHDELICMNSL